MNVALFWLNFGMFVFNKMAVTQSLSFDDARFGDALCLFPNISDIKEKQKKCLNLLLKRKDVLGLLPTGFGKSLIYQLFEIKC